MTHIKSNQKAFKVTKFNSYCNFRDRMSAIISEYIHETVIDNLKANYLRTA